ncbi:PACE efflux transporter [Roseovarius sp. D0-M9]|uniref:PACE efflux transporter n=1 Tax=Roseovarius sp. D0-M9 TaxID=3127117 RepID=UPI00300FB935
MRSPLDRLRHAVSYEIIALILVIPLGAIAFQMPIQDIGVVGVVGVTLAALWNIFYNYIFDIILKRTVGTTEKSGRVRVLHAVLFEVGFMIVLMPFMAWYLGISLWQSFLMKVSFSLFYMVYTLGFNWAYDKLFPLPEWKNAAL